jgi:hypothetical protein
LEVGAAAELYRALDWLGARQAAIEAGLPRRHLEDGALVLYDVSSSWLEGRCCELARFGYSRDGKKGKLQIVYGLLCAADGCPVAVEVIGTHLQPASPRKGFSDPRRTFRRGGFGDRKGSTRSRRQGNSNSWF